MGRLRANVSGVLVKRGRDTRDGQLEKRPSEGIATRHFIYKPRRWVSEEANPTGTLILDLTASKL